MEGAGGGEAWLARDSAGSTRAGRSTWGVSRRECSTAAGLYRAASGVAADVARDRAAGLSSCSRCGRSVRDVVVRKASCPDAVVGTWNRLRVFSSGFRRCPELAVGLLRGTSEVLGTGRRDRESVVMRSAAEVLGPA